MKFHKIIRNFTESLKSPIYQIPARANEINLYLWISWNQYNTVRQTNYDSGKWKRIRQKPYYWLPRCLFGNFCLMSNPLPSHHSPCYSSCGNKIYNQSPNDFPVSSHIYSSIPQKTGIVD